MQTVSTLASYVESDITIFSAVKPTGKLSPGAGGEDERTMREFHEKLTHKYFPQKVLMVGSDPEGSPDLISTQGATLHSRIVEGDPADTICRYAETMNADLVVVGKRGGGNIGSLLLGSVSEKVVHKCTRSVLVAKDNTNGTSRTDTSTFEHGHSHHVGHKH